MKSPHYIKLSLVILTASLFFAYWFSNAEGTVRANIVRSGLVTPTGITASIDKYSNKTAVEWNTVPYADLYRIYRGQSPNHNLAEEVGSTESNFFFDLSAEQGQSYYYWVRAENTNQTSQLSHSSIGRVANTAPQGTLPPLNPPQAPGPNQLTASKIELGKTLFWDEQMSSTRTVSCGTCHITSAGGSDPRTSLKNTRSHLPGPDGIPGNADDVFASPGVPMTDDGGITLWNVQSGMDEQVTPRKANSTINAAYSTTLFWDGRATPSFIDPLTNEVLINFGAALESQSIEPILSDVEMAHNGRLWSDVTQRLSAAKPLALSSQLPEGLKLWIGSRTYPELFEDAFGTAEITPSRIAFALANYQRTLFSDQTPFDQYLYGIAPLTEQEDRGRQLFNATSCNVCHAGTLFTNHTFRNIGIRPQHEDTGRFQVTNNPLNLAEFKIPGLRNVQLRAPFMHNGRFQTLEEVVEFYDRGSDFPNAPNFPADQIRPRDLSPQQKADLVAFLKRPLTDPRVAEETGKFARPKLFSESNLAPAIEGQGTAGSARRTPTMHAISPPIIGNPNFTVSVSNALAGASATLVIDRNDPGNAGPAPQTGSFARLTTVLNASPGGEGYASVSMPIPNESSLIGRTFFGRWYVGDPGASNGTAVSQLVRFKVFSSERSTASAAYVDFDGDGRTDVSVYRPSDGVWYVINSSDNTFSAINFGVSTDRIVTGDFDGDGKTDRAVFRDGTWYILQSRDGVTAFPFGLEGDIPQPGDYDGDGKTDAAVFRPSNGVWYILGSSSGFSAIPFGLLEDKPIASDFDGDGKTDIAVYRNGIWYILGSRDGFMAYQFGLSDDLPLVSDHDGDGKTDISVWRPSTGVWHILQSSNGAYNSVQFGVSSDVPSPGDYNGDGKWDLTVFRPSTGEWFIWYYGTATISIPTFGLGTDISIPSTIVP